MGEYEESRITTVVVAGDVSYSFSEVCGRCRLTGEDLQAMVEEGLLHPQGQGPAQWRFSTDELLRAKTALRLQHDLGLNLPGVALALDLLDELQSLRARVRLLEKLAD